jgi:hypothetical protein
MSAWDHMLRNGQEESMLLVKRCDVAPRPRDLLVWPLLSLTNSRAHDVQDGFGMPRRDLEEDSRRSLRLPTALLPVAKRLDADPQHRGEIQLRELERIAEAFHVGIVDDECTGRQPLTPEDGSPFPDTRF